MITGQEFQTKDFEVLSNPIKERSFHISNLTDVSIDGALENVKKTVRNAITDFLAVTIAGLKEEPCLLLADYVTQKSIGDVPLLGFQQRVDAQDAALVLGTSGHVLDYDDISSLMIGHPTAVLAPVLLTLGYEQKSNGQDLLEAYILGYEIIGKISEHSALEQYNKGWHTTATIGIMGATRAAARILNLTNEETENALGISASLAGGLKSNFGSMTKPLHAGWVASNAIFAARMSQKGLKSNTNALYSNESYFSTFGGSFNPKIKRHSLFLEEGILIKPYPSCGQTTRAIDCALQLRKEIRSNIDNIEEIKCKIPPLGAKILKYPLPNNGTEAKFSLEFCISQAILYGKLENSQFDDHFVQKHVKEDNIMFKIKMETTEYLLNNEGEKRKEFAEIEVCFSNGLTISATVFHPKGHPKNPLTENEFRNKFDSCTSQVFDASKQEEIFNKLMSFDSLSSINETIDKINQYIHL